MIDPAKALLRIMLQTIATLILLLAAVPLLIASGAAALADKLKTAETEDTP